MFFEILQYRTRQQKIYWNVPK